MDASVDSQIITSLNQIFKAAPLNKCIKCHKCINGNFAFTLENNNKIQSSMKCSNTDSIVTFDINDFYTNEDNNEKIRKAIPKESRNKSIFNSTEELYNFVLDKIKNNITYKNEMINRIKKTHYINSRDKEKMISKLMDSFNNNMKINIECYKILHFLLYNEIQFKEKGYKFPFQDYINISYSFFAPFDLVEKSIYNLISYYNYKFLIKFHKRHNYSFDNSFTFDYHINVDLQLFNGQFIGRDNKYDELYLLSYHPNEPELKNKIKEEKKMQTEFNTQCIQINSEVLIVFLRDTACFVSVENFVPIKSIDNSEYFYFKTSNGKIISMEGNITIYKIDEENLTLNPETNLKSIDSNEHFLEYKENKIIFFQKHNICVYDCNYLQYEFVICGYSYDLFRARLCFLPGDKLVLGDFCKSTLLVFDLHNPRLIYKPALERRTFWSPDIGENLIWVNNENLFFVYNCETFIFNYKKQSKEKVEKAKRLFLDDFLYSCDGRILAGTKKYMMLYSFDEKVMIDTIGYTLEAEQKIKTNFYKNSERIEAGDGLDYCYIRTYLNSEIIIVTLENKTIFFF